MCVSSVFFHLRRMKLPLQLVLISTTLIVYLNNANCLPHLQSKNSKLFVTPTSNSYVWKTIYLDRKIDNYNFAANTPTFKQKVLINDTYFTSKTGPIFFYTGNEGTIEDFAENTGFIWDYAPQFKALIVFAEHRYYGTSLPFGQNSFDNTSTTQYLTVEQALRDYVETIRTIKTNYAAPNSKVIAIGGSYGGMLACWLRQKYPVTVAGAYAASAPIWQFTSLTPCEVFNNITTRAYASVNAKCAEGIRESWNAIREVFTKKQTNLLTSYFNLCSDIKNEMELEKFIDFLNELWVNMAMANYPYKANFLANLPAWPVKAACNRLTDIYTKQEYLLPAISAASQVFTNYTGTLKCLNATGSADPSDLGTLGWSFQVCNEMVMPMCSDNINDMFQKTDWDLSAYKKDCIQNFGTSPDEFWEIKVFGGKEFSLQATNIFFTNGHLDPWSGGGVVKSLSNSLIAYYLPNGAHHVDLRGSHPEDTSDIIEARDMAVSLIEQWIRNET